MGFVGGLLGTAGGVNGTGISGPQQANITQPTTADQATNSYNWNQGALQQQQLLLNALQQQNGIGNQSSVYNQLQGVANGTGPNPATAQLAQATGANTANQAALMAGQRGSGANAGLIARQAAQQGAANQQNAAGQAASLQAQQSLGALNQLGGIAGQQVAQQQNQANAITGAQQGEQQNLLNSIAQQNNATVGSQSSVNSGNTQLANTTMQGQQALLGGTMNAASSVLSSLAEGGEVRQNYDAGGSVPQQDTTSSNYQGISPFGAYISNQNKGNTKNNKAATPSQFNYGNAGANQLAAGTSNALSNVFSKLISQGNAPPAYSNNNPIISGGPQDNSGDIPGGDSGELSAAEGGKVPALVSPGEQYLPPKEVKKVLKGQKKPLEAGERIPGKPKYPGNDYRNDTVKKTLKEGGLVIPNEVMQSKNPHWEAMKFVHAHTRNLKKAK